MAHSGTSSRRSEAGGGAGGGGGGMRAYMGLQDVPDWEGTEALRQRELEEARARAAQMEKTMRWWSDCTANWREKWSKVRNERNKAREEAKLLRSKLDSALKDANTYRREKQELEAHNEQMRKELERIHLLLLKHAGQWDHQLLEALDCERDSAASAVTESRQDTDRSAAEKDSGIDEYIAQGATGHGGKLDELILGGGDDSCSLKESLTLTNGAATSQCADTDSWTGTLDTTNDVFASSIIGSIKKEPSSVIIETAADQEIIYQKLSMLQLRLDETTKTLQVERDEKLTLHKSLERLEVELAETKEKCEELRASRQEAVRELLQLQDQHEDTVALIRADLLDEASSREGMDRRLADLRAQLERLQAENASEWGKRERLETEKLALERENKKLRAELRDAQERLERRARPVTTADTDLRQLQQEVTDKSKELSDIKHAHNKLKKVVSDKTTELAHMTRRAEQYEAEVKRLRCRVEELKRELAVAEDEVDSASNNIRKLQRTNDELQEQVEGLQVQVEHLHTRMRCSVGSHRSPAALDKDEDEDDQSDEDNY